MSKGREQTLNLSSHLSIALVILGDDVLSASCLLLEAPSRWPGFTLTTLMVFKIENGVSESFALRFQGIQVLNKGVGSTLSHMGRSSVSFS